MSPLRKLGLYAVVLALAFVGGAALGDAVGPLDTSGGEDPPHDVRDTPDGHHGATHEEGSS